MTGVRDGREVPLLAIEYCAALPAGNQAWQRCGRAYSYGLAGVPFLYVAELGGFELDSLRERKAARLPNPAVPFSYISHSVSRSTPVLPVFISNPGADTASRDTVVPWGKQHVFLFTGPRGDVKPWKDSQHVLDKLKKQQLEHLFNARLPLVLPEELTLSSITHAAGRLRVTAIQKREYSERAPEHDDTKVTEGDGEVILKAYVNHVSRTLVAFEWDLNANVAMLQITQLNRDSQMATHAVLWHAYARRPALAIPSESRYTPSSFDQPISPCCSACVPLFKRFHRSGILMFANDRIRCYNTYRATSWESADLIQKRICMLGAYAVGKTSLVRQFVRSMFDEKYHATIGVKIDKKIVAVRGNMVQLMLWDIAGAEDHFTIPSSYIRGTAGCLMVIDGTRLQTVDRAFDLIEQLNQDIGSIPLVIVLNKCDLTDQWQLDDAQTARLAPLGCPIIRSSAKTGEGVEAAFTALAERIIPE